MLVEVERGEHDHASVAGARGEDPACGFEAVVRFGDDLQVGVGVEDRAQSGARERVVVGDQHEYAAADRSAFAHPRDAAPDVGLLRSVVERPLVEDLQLEHVG